MKKFIVDKEFFDLFPDASIAILVIDNVKENINLDDDSLKAIKNILDDANKEAKKYLTSDVISENEVVKVWREAYQRFPNKKGARCSVENLLKRVLHDNPVGTIFPSVDITNAISLKYALPIGVEDLDKVVGDIHLGAMKGGEDFFSDVKTDVPLTAQDRTVCLTTCTSDENVRFVVFGKCVSSKKPVHTRTIADGPSLQDSSPSLPE